MTKSRMSLFTAALFSASFTALAAQPYAVVISTNAWADPGWRQVAETLQKKHSAKVFRYGNSVRETLPDLQKLFPSCVCFVTPPAAATRSFVAEVNRLTRELDSDPYTDCFWGILTGYDAANAREIAAEKKPLAIRNVLSATPIPLERAEQGAWFSELKAGQVVRKKPGSAPAEEQGAADSTEAIANALSKDAPGLFITSGHATEHDWQIGYSYRNGSFQCSGGSLFGVDTRGRKIPVASPNPKVYLAVGNCLMGHIDGPDCMALAYMKSAGVRQMAGYTVSTWYGYGGWGWLDYFYEQPGRYSFAEAFAANQAALVYRLQTYFPELAGQKVNLDNPAPPAVQLSPAAAKAGLTAQDGFGLLHDRDAVAFYGDPAWDARLALGSLDWGQTLAQKGKTWTFEIKPQREERSFSNIDKNGSQRGGRPFVQFLPVRIGPARVIEGAGLQPVITDNFILLPNPGTCDPSQTFRVVFEASQIL